MRNSRVALTAVLISSSLMACSQNQSKGIQDLGPVNRDQTLNALNWTLKLQSQCADSVAETECVGQYGFSIDSTGKSVIGPGPAGELRVAQLQPGELKLISGLLASTLSASAPETPFSLNASEEQLALDEEALSADEITLARSREEGKTILKAEQKSLLSWMKSQADAKALYSAIRSLAKTYYAPLPFPNECQDGLNTLKALVEKVTSCQTDTDCAYFDLALDEVAESSDAYLDYDTCSELNPLVVGNRQKVEESKEELLTLIGHVQGSCGTQLSRANCTQTQGFKLPGPKATCQNNKCALPASLLSVAPSSNPASGSSTPTSGGAGSSLPGASGSTGGVRH